MRVMQDTSLKWLGKIPADWSLTKIGGLYSIRNEKVSDKDYPPLSVTNKGILPQLDTAAKTNDGDNRKLVRIGDFVINSRSDRRGSCGISPYDGSVSLINIVMMPRKSMVPTYYEWLFHTTQFGDENYRWGHGIVDDLWTTGWQEMKKITIPFPPIEEQARIADFLTEKCSELDELAGEIQTQIDILTQYKRSVIAEIVIKGLNTNAEMKDSGIQWLGQIPSHWNVCKIGGLYTVRREKVSDKDYPPLSVSMKGVVPQLETAAKTNDGDNRKLVRKGDFAINSRSDRRGSCGISEYDGSVSLINTVLAPRSEMNPKYYNWLFHTTQFADEFYKWGHGIVDDLWTTRWEEMKKITIPVPPLADQELIADTLDKKCSKVDAVIAEKREQYSTLIHYKKSLIFEYVTGKKEVPAPITAVMVDPNVILLGKLPKLLSKQKGKIYNQKVLYLLNTHLGLNLGVQYYRYKHGPYDIMLDSYIDTLVENGWCVKTVNNGAENLEIGPNYGAFEEEYGSHFSEHDAEIKNLILFVQPMKRSQIERVATLFAVWNDMILDGKSTPTDAEIVSEVMSGWTENKANFAHDTWLDTLNKMRKQGIIPTGQGFHTLPMPQRGVNNA